MNVSSSILLEIRSEKSSISFKLESMCSFSGLFLTGEDLKVFISDTCFTLHYSSRFGEVLRVYMARRRLVFLEDDCNLCVLLPEESSFLPIDCDYSLAVVLRRLISRVLMTMFSLLGFMEGI